MKKRLINITIIVMSLTAMLELALSQVHIKTITQVFATNIGFYLFSFILLGLIIIFNVLTIKKDCNKIMLTITTVLSTIIGLKYIQILIHDINNYSYVGFTDIKNSLILTIIGMFVYIIGTIILVVNVEKAIEKS